MELPAATLQLLSGQVLLIGSLLVVEGKEEGVEVHLDECALPVVHSRCREVSLLVKVRPQLSLLICVICKEHRIFHWQGARFRDVDAHLILKQRRVDEGAVQHIEQQVLFLRSGADLPETRGCKETRGLHRELILLGEITVEGIAALTE